MYKYALPPLRCCYHQFLLPLLPLSCHHHHLPHPLPSNFSITSAVQPLLPFSCEFFTVVIFNTAKHWKFNFSLNHITENPLKIFSTEDIFSRKLLYAKTTKSNFANFPKFCTPLCMCWLVLLYCLYFLPVSSCFYWMQ